MIFNGFVDMLKIPFATNNEYCICSDDIGSMVKCEIRSRENPDCFESSVIGPIKINKKCKEFIR